MDGRSFLWFTAGIVVGALVTWVVRRLFFQPKHAIPPWDILSACTQADGKIRIEVNPPTSTTELEFVKFHSDIVDTAPSSLPSAPGSGAVHHGTTSPLVQVHPLGGLSGPSDCVLVWAEFRTYSVRSLVSALPSCSGSGSGSMAMARSTRAVTPEAAQQLEAMPRAYLVLPDSSAPATELTEAAKAVLEYVSEASTPTEPFWRGRGESGAVREWALSLLHRAGGFGAVLSALCLVDGREVRLTWVTSDWRFHATNRLLCESDDARGLSLLVRPA